MSLTLPCPLDRLLVSRRWCMFWQMACLSFWAWSLQPASYPVQCSSTLLFYMFFFTQLNEQKTRSTNLEGALHTALQPQSTLMLLHSAMEIRKWLQNFQQQNTQVNRGNFPSYHPNFVNFADNCLENNQVSTVSWNVNTCDLRACCI